mmetsp:Transcript_19094/g.32802  ORF Transcript_19094/g.32802 Transcript_19094/m.32802 type:complete len:147 (+) Transcript_19094:311-751(+)
MFQLRDTVGTSPQTDLKLTELSSVVPSLVVAKTHHDFSPFPTVLAILRQRRISRTGFWFGTISLNGRICSLSLSLSLGQRERQSDTDAHKGSSTKYMLGIGDDHLIHTPPSTKITYRSMDFWKLFQASNVPYCVVLIVGYVSLLYC